MCSSVLGWNKSGKLVFVVNNLTSKFDQDQALRECRALDQVHDVKVVEYASEQDRGNGRYR